MRCEVGKMACSFETVGFSLGGGCEDEIMAGKHAVCLVLRSSAESGLRPDQDTAASSKGLGGSGMTGQTVNWISAQFYIRLLG